MPELLWLINISFNVMLYFPLGGARVNNIICEEIVGMFSNLQRRSPNATIMNLASKIKATKNKTMVHIMAIEETQRNQMIMKVVRISSRVKKQNKIQVIKMHEDISNRVKVKIAEKQKKRRGQIERKLRGVIKDGEDICKTLECTEKKGALTMDIINGRIIGKRMIHVWYDEERKVDVTWNGRFIRADSGLSSKDPLMVVNYWEKSDGEDEGEETPVSVYQLAADFYCDDLVFVV